MKQLSAQVGLFFIAIIALSCGSAIQSRSFKKLPDMDNVECYSQEQDNLSVSVQLFTHQDCKHYFGCDLISYGYRPLLLEIKNDGDSLFLFKPLLFNIELVRSSEIVKHIKFPVTAILAAVGLPVLYHYYRIAPIVGLAGMGFWYYNKKIESDLLESTLDEESILKVVPFSKVKKVIFVKEQSFLSKFDIHLNNETQRTTLTFHVDLLQKKRSNNPFIPYATPW